MKKIIRSVCAFAEHVTDADITRVQRIRTLLAEREYDVQTLRICTPTIPVSLNRELENAGVLIGRGSVSLQHLPDFFQDFLRTDYISFHFDLSNEEIRPEHVDMLLRIIRERPDGTFRFTYGIGLPDSSPFFPSARYGREGFSVGLQPPDLAEGCATPEEWCQRMKGVWAELEALLRKEQGWLGIDSSVAPLFDGPGSLVRHITRWTGSFEQSVTSRFYTQLSQFIQDENPRPVGLCGLMFPCLEDFALADEYAHGRFSVERNIFLSLHSGTGIDTYPIGTDEKPRRVMEILTLLQALSRKHRKPLSARFVSDGKAKIGEKTNFKNRYLKDVRVRPL